MANPANQPAKKKKISTSNGSPSYDSYRFLSNEHQQWYRLIDNRNLLPERKVILQAGEYEDIQQELRKRNWIKLAKYPAPANVAIVKEFYANAMVIKVGEPTFKSFVRGKRISFSGRAINRFLGTELNLGPNGGQYVDWCKTEKDYSKVVEKVCKPGGDYVVGKTGQKQKIMRGDLLPLAQIWKSFLHSNISPCSHTSDIHVRRSHMLYAIMAGLPMDVGAVIAMEIHLTANSLGTNSQLGHPSLITELCRLAGVDVSEPPFQKPRQPINAQFIIKNCVGSGTSASSLRPVPPASPRTPCSITQRLGALEADQTLIHQKLDALYRSQVMMMESMQSLSSRISQGSHFPSVEEFDAHVAWPQHPVKQNDLEEGDEHVADEEGGEHASDEEGVSMLLMLKSKMMSNLETR